MLTLYGISNCDTVRKARKWLDAQNIPYQFHDFRKDGLSGEHIKRWIEQIGVEALVNKRGTTWRQLPSDKREAASLQDIETLLLECPTLIKRPLLEGHGLCHVGFSETTYTELTNGVCDE